MERLLRALNIPYCVNSAASNWDYAAYSPLDAAAHLSSPGKKVRWLDVQGTARKAVASLREAGADVVIGLTHLELSEDQELARSVKGLDIILGGHMISLRSTRAAHSS
jgi:hypothetical protein